MFAVVGYSVGAGCGWAMPTWLFTTCVLLQAFYVVQLTDRTFLPLTPSIAKENVFSVSALSPPWISPVVELRVFRGTGALSSSD